MKFKTRYNIDYSVGTTDLKETFSKGDSTKGLVNCIKSQKLIMIPGSVIALTIYQSVITKPCSKRQS